jgi:hypothetical protein
LTRPLGSPSATRAVTAAAGVDAPVVLTAGECALPALTRRPGSLLATGCHATVHTAA